MKRVWLRILCALLAMILLFGTVGCNNGGTEDNTTVEGKSEDGSAGGDVTEESTENVTEDPEYAGKLKLYDNGSFLYKVITPEKVGAYAQKGISTIVKSVNDIYGGKTLTASICSDVPDSRETLEILIGETNRAESGKADDYETYSAYSIKVVGNKIVINGGSDCAVQMACERFAEIMFETEIPAVSKTLDIKEDPGHSNYLVAMTDQYNSRVVVFDLALGDLNNKEAVVWEYKMPYYNVAGVKLRRSEKYGLVMIAVCGSSYGCVVSYPEGEVIFETQQAANNPHSIELLPDDVVVIASSTGNALRFFNIESPKRYTEYYYYGAHGVLWDPENECLWGFGGSTLQKLKVENLETKGKFTITQLASYTTPTGNLHDLAPVYGDTNRLWVTGSAVYQFDKKKEEFVMSGFYASDVLSKSKYTPGVGNFPDGSVAYVTPDGEFKDWTEKSLFFGLRLADGSYKFTQMFSKVDHYYKLRVWCADYQ